MSHLRYDGEGAGLGKQERGGDRNSPFNYTVICTCKAELGPLGKFAPNADGARTALCLRCEHITVVDKEGQTASCYKAPPEVLARFLSNKRSA